MPSHFAKKFIVGGGAFSLAKIDPRDDSAFPGKDEAKARIKEDAEAIDALQDRLYAEGTRSLLVVLQGIDCSGKDGTVRAVFNTCGPIGVVLGTSALEFDSPTTLPIFSPPPASASVDNGAQWSRPALPLTFGVRPNSPVMTSSTSFCSPRCFRSSRNAETA